MPSSIRPPVSVKLPVVDQPLRRDLALAPLVAPAAVVVDQQPAPLQQGRAHGLEVRQVDLARPDGLHADAAHDFGAGVGAHAEQLVQPFYQRRDVRPEQATRIQVGQQVLHRQQGVNLLGREPEPGQFVLRAGGGGLPVEPPAAALAVEHDRCVHAVAQVRQVALERGRGGAQCLEQEWPRQAAARVKPMLQTVKALGL